MATTKSKQAAKPKAKPKKPIKKAATKSGKKKPKVSAVANRARKLGLESMGYGRWGKLGRITHSTKGGKLTEVKDSKHNRNMSREGKVKANTALTKLKAAYALKMVKVKTAIQKAKGRGDDAQVKHLTSVYEKVRKEGQKAHERTVKLGIKRKAA